MSHRQWVNRNVSVLHFNTLCRPYEHDHLPNGAAQFANRFKTVLGEINGKADVVTLNECNPVSEYKKALCSDYDVLFSSKGQVGKADAPLADLRLCTDDSDDGAAILLRRGVVEAVRAWRVPVREVAVAKFAASPDGHLQQQRGAPDGAPALLPEWSRQFALIVLVHHVATRRQFFVATMHMKANGNDGVPGGAQDAKRVGQAYYVLQAFEAIRSSGSFPDAAPLPRGMVPAPPSPAAPLIFTGDFNARPEAATTQFLLSGRSQVTPQSVVVHHGFQFTSAMAEARGGQEPDFTILDSAFDKEGWSATLDYILYERSRMALTGFLTTPKAGAWGVDAIPWCGSDHLPIVAEFTFL